MNVLVAFGAKIVDVVMVGVKVVGGRVQPTDDFSDVPLGEASRFEA